MLRPRVLQLVLFIGLASVRVSAQSSGVIGTVHDETGGALRDVIVVVRDQSGASQQTVTDAQGAYRFEKLTAGRAQLSFDLINFAGARRDAVIPSSDSVQVDVVMHLALSADVTVTGKSTFSNLADVEDPAQNLVGIAQSASQGAITARQLDTRPVMRTGEVLETVPGVVISQHSGEGKANQYYLRGFNLDHGTDFSTSVAGIP